jgi:catechol 2,3-dioxygenase-like lactoylglutathione lyase family enzyme
MVVLDVELMGNAPTVEGIHHVVIPVSDLLRSRDWYGEVLNFAPILDFEEEDRLVGIALEHPCGASIWLRHDPERAGELRGHAVVALTVANRAELDRWERRLVELDVEHTQPHHGPPGWVLELTDPDGIEIRLRTHELASPDDETSEQLERRA